MLDVSEKAIKNRCPHCDPDSFALKHPLKETKRFWIVCDVHPIVEGHVLIIPKKHLSCVGEYDDNFFSEFQNHFNDFSKFLAKTYGTVATFEHGKIGQTVFHSHVHLFPYQGKLTEIIPEGKKYLFKLENLSELKDRFQRDGQYLFFSIGKDMWTVDLQLGGPRFFRDRFSKALGVTERGNWKEMHADKELMKKAKKDIENLKKNWEVYSNSEI